MLKILLTIIFLALAVPAHAGNFTLALLGAATQASDKQIGSIGGSIGYDFGLVRFAVEGMQYEEHKISWTQNVDRRADPLKVTCEANVRTLFLTAALDLENSTPWTPYVQAGAGYAFYDIKLRGSTTAHITVWPWPTQHIFLEQEESWKQTEPAWFAGAGVEYDLSFILAGLSADFGVRYLDLGTIRPPAITVEKMGYQKEIDLDSQRVRTGQVFGGLRWRF